MHVPLVEPLAYYNSIEDYSHMIHGLGHFIFPAQNVRVISIEVSMFLHTIFVLDIFLLLTVTANNNHV